VALAGAGCAVVPVGRGVAELEAAAADIRAAGGRTLDVPAAADVRDAALLAALARRIESELGPIDILVAAAGVARFQPLLDLTELDWEETLAVNLTGAWNAVRAVAPGMVRSGRGDVVLLSSVAALKPFAGCGAYGATKAGLAMMGAVLREELRDAGVRVTTITAGATETPIWGPELPAPAERLMPPELVAEAVLLAVAADRRGTIEDSRLRPRLGDL
jgi:NAD(P)-dependent dehydrogenase (short-subunit alcohol dehydrogenase family)